MAWNIAVLRIEYTNPPKVLCNSANSKLRYAVLLGVYAQAPWIPKIGGDDDCSNLETFDQNTPVRLASSPRASCSLCVDSFTSRQLAKQLQSPVCFVGMLGSESPFLSKKILFPSIVV